MTHTSSSVAITNYPFGICLLKDLVDFLAMSHLGQRLSHCQRQTSETCTRIQPRRAGAWALRMALPAASARFTFCKQKSTECKSTPTWITIWSPLIYQELCFLTIFWDEVVSKACQWHCSGSGLCHTLTMVPTLILTADEPIPWGAAPTLRKTGQEGGTKGAIAHPPGFSWDREPEGPSGWPTAYRVASDAERELNPHPFLRHTVFP